MSIESDQKDLMDTINDFAHLSLDTAQDMSNFVLSSAFKAVEHIPDQQLAKLALQTLAGGLLIQSLSFNYARDLLATAG